MINGTEVVNNDGNHGIEEQSGAVLLPGGLHPIEILYFENTGGESLEVLYEGPSIGKQNIPFSILYPYSDTDNDGMPNSLDLDSDGDGCLDAIEGGGSFIAENLDPNNRLNPSGLSPSGINANGILNAVGSSGQSIGDSQDSEVMDIDCAAGGSLPIELLSITAIPKKAQYVKITWETLTETNNEYFTVERSRDAEVWEIASKLDGAGTTTEIQKYQITDNQPFLGTSYYRLKQTDYDGKYTYSKSLEVYIDPGTTPPFQVYPNPTTELLTIEGSPDDVEAYRFYDIQGKEVGAKVRLVEQGNFHVTVDVSRLQKGTYILETPGQSVKVTKQ